MIMQKILFEIDLIDKLELISTYRSYDCFITKGWQFFVAK